MKEMKEMTPCPKCKLITGIPHVACALCREKMCVRCLKPHYNEHLAHLDVTKAAMRDANAVKAGETDDGEDGE